MSLPWLQDVDPAELLPDDTKWEEHDEFTLWKQCKLRGLDGDVKKEGDALQILNTVKTLNVRWQCAPKTSDYPFSIPERIIRAKAFEGLMKTAKQATFQVLDIFDVANSAENAPGKVIKLPNATVEFGRRSTCTCNHEYKLEALRCGTCVHRIYLGHYLLKTSQDICEWSSWQTLDDISQYFANAPIAFKPRHFVNDQYAKDPISNDHCQLCFKKADVSNDTLRCGVCRRIAHRECCDVYRTLKSECKEKNGCSLCCPECPWNPTQKELKAEPKTEHFAMTPKKEPVEAIEESKVVNDDLSTAMARRNRMLEKKVRRLRCHLRRKPASRVMSALRYERLAGKIGRKGAKYRRNQLSVVAKETLKSEDVRPKDEGKAAVFKEEMESPVKIVKVEKRRKVKSEPVVISLL